MKLDEQQHSIALQRLIDDDAVGQLYRREGRMAELGSEDGVLKLDWVEGIARLLANSTWLETVEVEARAIWKQGIRHIIWAGMGGSIITVRVLVEMGFGGGGQHEQSITIHPLDSTDPAALNDIVRTLAYSKGLSLPSSPASAPDKEFLHTLLEDVMMIGVSMGMTSEEPITHLKWFTALLEQAELQPSQQLLIMTLPNSYLDAFAQQYQVPTRPLQLDSGTGTGGRMSAPTTRVFLLPAALYLTRLSSTPGLLRRVLQQAWQQYDIATTQLAVSPFVQLAATMSDASKNGACRLFLTMSEGWQALVQWIEQLMEESLGKGSKGVVVFDAQKLNTQALYYSTDGTLPVQVVTDSAEMAINTHVHLYQPYLASTEPLTRLAALTTSFLSWQLCMALYGYLHAITFAGQPAVENYKARARTLRNQADPLQVLDHWQARTTHGRLTLFAPQTGIVTQTPAQLFANALVSDKKEQISYLDCTFNGIASPPIQAILERQMHALGNTLLGVPMKIRQAPAAYHSTEQSEMDGPPYLISLRILIRTHETSILGSYTDTFLRAQAVSTWQAMIEQGRRCYLLLVDGNMLEAAASLTTFFETVEQQMKAMNVS